MESKITTLLPHSLDHWYAFGLSLWPSVLKKKFFEEVDPCDIFWSRPGSAPGLIWPKLVGWLVVLRIYVALAVFQPYRDLEAGDNQSLKIQVARPGIGLRSSAPQAKSLTTRPPLLQIWPKNNIYNGPWVLHPYPSFIKIHQAVLEKKKKSKM